MPKINYSQELNPTQLEAVQSVDGPFLLIAGAGSGKTRVLVYRTAYLVEQGVSPERILLLTFTRKASQEMLDRASQICDDSCRKVSGGTFHSFANSVLRRYGHEIGLSRAFSILDQSESEQVISTVRSRLGLHKGDKRFPKKGTLLSVISKSINKCTSLEAVLAEEYPSFLEWSDHIFRVKEEYIKYKKSFSMLDYDDLLIFLRDLLVEHAHVRDELAERYQYIMVDEYQDTNKIQAEIVELLAQHHKNVMVVGDDAQSIYSFRGANFRNIIDFPSVFPGAQLIILEENYRSAQPILDLTNEVIRSSAEKYDKELFSSKVGEQRPTYVDIYNEHQQSRYIVNKILELKSSGIPFSQIAVLFRSGWHSNDLEVELSGNGIAFAKYGGQKFIDAAHIKDLMAYLKIIYNPYDEISWQRILTTFKGVGPRTAQKIVQEMVARKGYGFEEKMLKKHAELGRLNDVLKKVKEKNPGLKAMLDIFQEFYTPIMMDQYDDHDKRANDLDSLARIAARYTDLETFLTDMALDPPEKSFVESSMKSLQDNKVVLSTIHSAKGLEWHTVFVIHLVEGALPSYRSFSREQSIEEERRLFYVATTRAKEQLYLLCPRISYAARSRDPYAGPMFARVSRFLEEGQILRKYIEYEDPYGAADVQWSGNMI